MAGEEVLLGLGAMPAGIVQNQIDVLARDPEKLADKITESQGAESRNRLSYHSATL